MIARYNKELNFYSIFNPDTGFFARIEGKNGTEPFWDSNGPELIDISITDHCDFNCSFCYKLTKNTKHLPFDSVISILEQASECGTFQIAYGGGNPNLHPNFVDILRETRQRNIIPNFTTNGNNISANILRATAEHCGAVGLSYYDQENFPKTINTFYAYGIKVNIHIVLTAQNVDRFTDLLSNPPEHFIKANALIFLKYKPVGLHIDYSMCAYKDLTAFFSSVKSASKYFKIGFDSCFVEAINSYLNVSSTYIEPCEAGRFSCYISESNRLYPCSFMEDAVPGVSLETTSLLEAWRDSSLFEQWRSVISHANCIECDKFKNCFGGCQLFPDTLACSYLKN